MDQRIDNGIHSPAFLAWVEDSLARRDNILAVSNQGTLLHYRSDGLDLPRTMLREGLAAHLRALQNPT